MAKRKHNSKNAKLAILFGASLMVSLFLVNAFPRDRMGIDRQTQNTISPTPTLKTYHSEFLDITIDIPNEFELEEKFGQIILEKQAKVITIHWIGTNKKYRSIDEFLDDGYRDNLTKTIDRQHVSVNGVGGILISVEYLSKPELDNKTYYFKVNDGFYSISTRSQNLYSDLDQIAQSFRYEP